MFAKVKASRSYLKSVKVYPILRELHLWEEEPELLDFIEELVQWFLADEEGEEATTESKIKEISEEGEGVAESKIEEITEEVEAL